MPVHYNPRTQEPYLRLPAPHSNIIITSHRPDQMDETCDRLCDMLNDSRVTSYLAGPPYPYLREHGEEWIRTKWIENERVLYTLRQEFEDLQSQQQPKVNGAATEKHQEFFDVCPFSCIREVLDEDPETGVPLRDVFIGDVGIMRYAFYELPYGSEEKTEAQRRNNALPAGDESIVWGIDFLDPAYHGRGIMTLVMRTVIHEWCAPRMNVRALKSCVIAGNEGSLRVFDKNNFERGEVLENWEPRSESRGGGLQSIQLVSWRGLS